MVSFLTIVSVPIYLYSNYGRVRLFLRPSQGCGFWVSPCNPEWWVPTTLPTPLIYLPHSQLSSCPTQRRVVFQKTTRGNDVEGRNSWCLLVEICVFIGLCTCQSPIAPQRSCEPILSCNQKEELNRPLTRPLKQEAGDSPCSHQRGTELQQKTPRRLAPTKAMGEPRPQQCTYNQASPGGGTHSNYQLMDVSS